MHLTTLLAPLLLLGVVIVDAGTIVGTDGLTTSTTTITSTSTTTITTTVMTSSSSSSNGTTTASQTSATIPAAIASQTSASPTNNKVSPNGATSIRDGGMVAMAGFVGAAMVYML